MAKVICVKVRNDFSYKVMIFEIFLSLLYTFVRFILYFWIVHYTNLLDCAYDIHGWLCMHVDNQYFRGDFVEIF